jgi:hypothetical protein
VERLNEDPVTAETGFGIDCTNILSVKLEVSSVTFCCVGGGWGVQGVYGEARERVCHESKVVISVMSVMCHGSKVVISVMTVLCHGSKVVISVMSVMGHDSKIMISVMSRLVMAARS